VAWSPARFDHTGISGNCFSCHNGSLATGKIPSHPPTSNNCEDCHVTTVWSQVRFDHAQVTGTCGSCHNGVTATGKGTNHFVTTVECDACHTTSAWTPVRRYSHSSPNYPGDHAVNPPCRSCHGANSQAVTWRFSAYRPDCAGCHANDFEPGEHRKVRDGANYTAGELRDCSGACHVYTDSSLTTIESRRSGEHRVTQGNWD
jgi:hypothetical protein